MKNNKIKFVPMLFSTAMVQAILAGNKTETRRTINPQPKDGFTPKIYKGNDFKYHIESRKSPIDLESKNWKVYEKGNVIWVRETFSEWGNGQYAYKADGFVKRYGAWERDTPNKLWDIERIERWKPSLFMPKEACRIWLKLTEIRLERLQNITEKDAIAEGILPVESFDSGAGISSLQMYKNYLPIGYAELLPIDSYKSLWQSINGNESWDLNPWVFVYKFDRLNEMPSEFLD